MAVPAQVFATLLLNDGVAGVDTTTTNTAVREADRQPVVLFRAWA
jgi:hypothetical protein